jgi:hypothetical protein
MISIALMIAIFVVYIGFVFKETKKEQTKSDDEWVHPGF